MRTEQDFLDSLNYVGKLIQCESEEERQAVRLEAEAKKVEARKRIEAAKSKIQVILQPGIPVLDELAQEDYLERQADGTYQVMTRNIKTFMSQLVQKDMTIEAPILKQYLRNLRGKEFSDSYLTRELALARGEANYDRR